MKITTYFREERVETGRNHQFWGRNQEEPVGGTRRNWEEPGGTGRNQEEPGGTGRNLFSITPLGWSKIRP